jgi:hypothetical protein
MPSLDDFESRLQSLLEVHLLRHLPGYKVQDGVAQRLANAMHGHLKYQNGETWAPNLYTIIGHPYTLLRWHNEPRLLDELAAALYAAGNEAGFQFSSKPSITTDPSGKLRVGELKIVASFSSENLEDTHGKPLPETQPLPTEETVPNNAFLIIGGTQIVPLDRSVVNIGRRLDNHVVIDDPRISRAHAQLRIVKGRFVLFDLDSSGGTFVNGQRTNQSVLYSGDVISLAGVTLIFGQDSPTRSPNEEKTGPVSPASGDRPTAILNRTDFIKKK